MTNCSKGVDNPDDGDGDGGGGADADADDDDESLMMLMLLLLLLLMMMTMMSQKFGILDYRDWRKIIAKLTALILDLTGKLVCFWTFL